MSRLRHFKISREFDNMSVKVYARKVLGISSRALIKQKYIEDGIMLNGRHCRTIDILRGGDLLSFTLEPEITDYTAVEGRLDILYQDENFIAVNKPANMPVHPSPGHFRDSLLNITAYHYESCGESHVFRPMYRLDKDTSGIVWIAKNRMAASSAVVEKTYFGICQGEITGQGKIELPIGMKEGSIITRETGHGEHAVTNWKAICSGDGHSLLSFHLETGRTHQIRVHMAAAGHPLAGDDMYGGSRDCVQRQALHCGETRMSCKAFELDIPLAADFPEDIQSCFSGLLNTNPHLNGDIGAGHIKGRDVLREILNKKDVF